MGSLWKTRELNLGSLVLQAKALIALITGLSPHQKFWPLTLNGTSEDSLSLEWYEALK